MKIIIVVVVFVFGFILESNGATRTWNGGSGSTDNWSDAANWDVLPVAGDALVFAGSTRTTPNNDFAAATNFASITFSSGASAFTLSGNSVTLTGGVTAITASNTSLTMTIGLNIIFSTSAPTITSTSGGTLSITGTIDNGGLLITAASVGTTTFSGIISGTGSITSSGAGIVTLSAANTYTGGVTLSAGTLNINNPTALGTIAGTFTIADGTTIDNTSGGSITISADNPMTWNGNFTFTGSNALNLGAGTAAMGASVRTITTTASTLTVGGLITGTAGLTKSGAGNITLGTVNSGSYWTGTTTINNGTLLLGDVGGDQYNCQTWIINSGGTLKWAASNRVNNSAVFTINSGGIMDMNGMQDALGSLAGAGNVNNNNSNINLSKPSNTDFSGVMAGSGTVVTGSSTNTQIFSGLNTYTGKTTIQQGTLSINTIQSVSGGSSSLGAPTSVANGTIDLGSTTTTGILKYTGTAQTTDRVINLSGTTGGGTIDQSGTGLLTFSSAFTATGVGAKTITLQGSTAGTGLISGAIVDGSGTTSLSKSGTGTWTLSGTNTYTGTTTVSAGILQLGAAGVIANTSNFIAAGGTLSTGTGAGYDETMGTITVSANTKIALGTGSHSLIFAPGTPAWTGSTLLRITGWQGGFDCTSGTSGKIYMGTTTELGAQLSQIFFTHPISGLPHTACQLNTGEVVPTGTLPVKLVSFTGEKVKSTNELYWITASEINCDYFEVLSSSDGINFDVIGKVNGAGNSANLLSYVFVDHAPLNGINYYKLVQYDFDGAHETFNIVAINNIQSEFKINALYPNPTASSMMVNFQSAGTGMYFLSILDDQGKELYSAIIVGIQGENTFSLATSSYSDGKYFVRIISPKNEIIAQQITVRH